MITTDKSSLKINIARHFRKYYKPAFNHISLFRMKIIVYKLSKFFKTFTKLNCAYSIGINVASITQEPGAIRNVKNYWLMGRSREV